MEVWQRQDWRTWEKVIDEEGRLHRGSILRKLARVQILADLALAKVRSRSQYCRQQLYWEALVARFQRLGESTKPEETKNVTLLARSKGRGTALWLKLEFQRNTSNPNSNPCWTPTKTTDEDEKCRFSQSEQANDPNQSVDGAEPDLGDQHWIREELLEERNQTYVDECLR